MSNPKWACGEPIAPEPLTPEQLADRTGHPTSKRWDYVIGGVVPATTEQQIEYLLQIAGDLTWAISVRRWAQGELRRLFEEAGDD